MFYKIYEKIKEFETIIIQTHSKPDGDAIGSQLGLKFALEATFPNKRIYSVGEVNERLIELGKMDVVSDDIYKEALVIVVDSGATHLISDSRYTLGKFVIKIDHHIPQGEYGDLAYVDQSFESTAGIIAQFVKEMNLTLTKEAAEALFTGIVTDSGRFRYASVNSQTFDNASYLMKSGVDLETIYNRIYLDELSSVKLRAQLTLKFETNGKGLAFMKNSFKEVSSYGTSAYNISRGMVNIMAGIEGIYIWANFTEDENGRVLVELRSRGPNINQVAIKYGGGGHLLASGATVSGFEIVDDMIKNLEMVMEEYNDKYRTI